MFGERECVRAAGIYGSEVKVVTSDVPCMVMDCELSYYMEDETTRGENTYD